MRYHVYTEARHPTGAVAAGHSLTVYDDAAGTELSDIYAAASGGSPLANPYVVPATGIVDFWATVPVPYTVASGDDTPRPLAIFVATTNDIGAASLTADNAMTGTQTITGKRLRVDGGAEGLGDYFGQIEIDKGPVNTVGCLGILDDGLPVVQYAIDEASAVIGMYTGEHTGIQGLADRFMIGRQTPFRVHLGDVNGYVINDAGQPFFQFIKSHLADLTEPCAYIKHPPGQIGTLLSIREDAIPGAVELELSAAGDLRVLGDIAPMANNASAVGSRSRAFKKTYLSDGIDPWAVTVNSSGTLVASKIRRNYCKNPSFEGAYVAGVAPGWRKSGAPNGTPVYSEAAALGPNGTKAQRWTYTSPGGELNHVVGAEMPEYQLAPFVAGDVLSISVLAKGAISNRAVHATIVWFNAALGYVGDAYVITIPALTSSPAIYSGTITVPATAVSASLVVDSYFSAGDTIDITLDDMLVGPAGDYFDGDSDDSEWAGPAHNSVSYEG